MNCTSSKIPTFTDWLNNSELMQECRNRYKEVDDNDEEIIPYIEVLWDSEN